MSANLSRQTLRNGFITRVEAISGQDLGTCYQCGKCSAGCPSVSQMDVLPNQLIRLAQLGLEEELLNSRSIWVCASCMTCTSRCPKGIDIAAVIEALRLVLLRQRRDNLVVSELTEDERRQLPPIALISSLRKAAS